MSTEHLESFHFDRQATSIEVVKNFIFLDSLIVDHGGCNAKIGRLTLGRVAMSGLECIWKGKCLNQHQAEGS